MDLSSLDSTYTKAMEKGIDKEEAFNMSEDGIFVNVHKMIMKLMDIFLKSTTSG